MLFGTPGSNNDVNIVYNSPLLEDFQDGAFPPCGFSYILNDEEQNIPYFLADGIYINWPIFANFIHVTSSVEEVIYNTKQEGARKKIECAFGSIKKRLATLKNPSRLHIEDAMYKIMSCCLIIHNMNIDSTELITCIEQFDDCAASIVPINQNNMTSHSTDRIPTTGLYNREANFKLRRTLSIECSKETTTNIDDFEVQFCSDDTLEYEQ